MKLRISSSLSIPLTIIEKWMRYIGKYSIFSSQVKRGGKIYVNYLSRDNFGVLVSMEQPTKVKEMTHQPLPPNQHKGFEKIDKLLYFVF
jgi:hypothetical protein